MFSFFGVSLIGSGGGDDSDLRIRVRDEVGPAGGMVQMKLMTTEVSPISGGRPMFRFNPSIFGGVSGFSVFNPDGEAAGAAIVNGDQVQAPYITTAPTAGEYPVMSVTLACADAVPGTTTEFAFNPQSTWFLSTSSAPLTARVSRKSGCCRCC